MSDATNLNHYLAAWGLSNPRLLTQTRTCHIHSSRFQMRLAQG